MSAAGVCDRPALMLHVSEACCVQLPAVKRGDKPKLGFTSKLPALPVIARQVNIAAEAIANDILRQPVGGFIFGMGIWFWVFIDELW